LEDLGLKKPGRVLGMSGSPPQDEDGWLPEKRLTREQAREIVEWLHLGCRDEDMPEFLRGRHHNDYRDALRVMCEGALLALCVQSGERVSEVAAILEIEEGRLNTISRNLRSNCEESAKARLAILDPEWWRTPFGGNLEEAKREWSNSVPDGAGLALVAWFESAGENVDQDTLFGWVKDCFQLLTPRDKAR